MASDYKPDLKRLMNNLIKSILTVQSGSALYNIFSILKNTPAELMTFSRQIRSEDQGKSIIPGKRSF